MKTLEQIETYGHSSKGNQLKWKDDNIWYKADYMGYEGLVEVFVSKMLEYSNIKEFVSYESVYLEFNKRKYVGCKSSNFLSEDEELVTVEKLFRQYTGKSPVNQMAKMEDIEERILYIVENVKRFTGLKEFGKYLSIALTIDAFFLNEDRHMNNIAVIYNVKEKQYRYCPYFDNGLSLFSDTTMDFPLKEDLEEYYQKIEAKPFSRSFDEQLDEIERLYGQHVKFQFTMRDVLRELEKLSSIYDKKIIQRVEKILRNQIRKYNYLCCQ